jgi:hypothetical protein
MKIFLSMAIMFLSVSSAAAIEVEGVDVPDSVIVAGKTLPLNGVGVRTKFFFDIYVGALYLPEKASTAAQAIGTTNPKRLTMTFLYDEVSRDKLVDGWNEGFEKNQSREAMKTLKGRLDQFNTMFGDGHRGDQFAFDFLEDGSTVVTLKAERAGVIEGTDFQRALLKVWLGDRPADKALKSAMLKE